MEWQEQPWARMIPFCLASLRMTEQNQTRKGAASRRKGRVMARKMSSRTPWTAMPMMRNGSKISQMKG